MDQYRFTPEQWATFKKDGNIPVATKVVVDSLHAESFQIFKCTGELYIMTCYIFLPAWKKDVAPYPRFDTTTVKTVYAGVYNGISTKTGD